MSTVSEWRDFRREDFEFEGHKCIFSDMRPVQCWCTEDQTGRDSIPVHAEPSRSYTRLQQTKADLSSQSFTATSLDSRVSLVVRPFNSSRAWLIVLTTEAAINLAHELSLQPSTSCKATSANS